MSPGETDTRCELQYFFSDRRKKPPPDEPGIVLVKNTKEYKSRKSTQFFDIKYGNSLNLVEKTKY